MEVLAHRISPDCWKPLGRRLAIKEARLIAYDRGNPKCCEKAYSMLLFWKARDRSAASYQVLYDALCHDLVGLGTLAKEFCCDRKLWQNGSGCQCMEFPPLLFSHIARMNFFKKQ